MNKQIKKTDKNDLVNNFSSLFIQLLVIAEELKSKKMLKYAESLSIEFFDKVKYYDNPYQNEVWEAENDKRNL